MKCAWIDVNLSWMKLVFWVEAWLKQVSESLATETPMMSCNGL